MQSTSVRARLLGCLVGAALLAPAGCAAADVGEDWQAQRQRMVEEQVKARGVQDERVLAALRKVPRHEYVPDSERAWA